MAKLQLVLSLFVIVPYALWFDCYEHELELNSHSHILRRFIKSKNKYYFKMSFYSYALKLI